MRFLSDEWLDALEAALASAAAPALASAPGGYDPRPGDSEEAGRDGTPGPGASGEVAGGIGASGEVAGGIGASGEVTGGIGRAGPARARLAIGQLVKDAPGGDVCYTVLLGGGEPPSVEHGSLDRANFTIVTDYATASAIASGTEQPADALGRGRMKIRGDTDSLLDGQGLLAALGPALAGLAAATEF